MSAPNLPYRTIPFDYQRVSYVSNYLQNLDEEPSPTLLNCLATFILTGMDEEYLTLADRHLAYVPSKDPEAHRSNYSLEYLDFEPNYTDVDRTRTKKINPTKPIRPTYDQNGTMIDPGDSAIPGMETLWKEIDETKQFLFGDSEQKAANQDQIRNKYKHLRNLYKAAYALKAATLYQDTHSKKYNSFNSLLSLDKNTGIWLAPEDWCNRYRHPRPTDLRQPTFENAPRNKDGLIFWKISDNAISLENPLHVRELLFHYTNLLAKNYEKIFSETRLLLWDLEAAIEMANLTDLEQFLLECYVAHRSTDQIRRVLAAENIHLENLQILRLMKKYLPKKIAIAAAKHRILLDKNIPTRNCTKCGRRLPLHSLFYARSADKRTGFCSQCKDCQKLNYEVKKCQSAQNVNKNEPKKNL